MINRRYMDLDVTISPGAAPGRYRARITQSPVGEVPSVEFDEPVDQQELELFLLRIGNPRTVRRRAHGPEAQAIQEFGSHLFDSVFAPDLRVALRRSMDQAEGAGAGLRIRLRMSDAPDLADLPWEYLYDSDTRRFLALSEWTPLVRYLELPTTPRPLLVSSSLRVLVMIASPTDLPELDSDQERQKLSAALEPLCRGGRVEMVMLPDGTMSTLRRALRRGEYHVFHFIGHGEFDDRSQDGALFLEDQRGRGVRVGADEIGSLLHDHRTLRLAVLNSCEGARTGRHDPYSGAAQCLVHQGVPAVIAMQFEISDTAAITFAETFYEAVADGYPIDASMAEARKAIRSTPNPVEWATPVLYLRAPDGQVFDFAQGAATTVRPRTQTSIDEPQTEPAAPTDFRSDDSYIAGLDAFFTDRWGLAAGLLREVAERFPHEAHVREQAEEAELQLKRESLLRDVVAAEGDSDWPAAARLLSDVLALRHDPAVAARLATARTNAEMAAAITDTERLLENSRWDAVVKAGERFQNRYGSNDKIKQLLLSAEVQLTRQRAAENRRRGLAHLAMREWTSAAEALSLSLQDLPDPDVVLLLERAQRGQLYERAVSAFSAVVRSGVETGIAPDERVIGSVTAVVGGPQSPRADRQTDPGGALLSHGMLAEPPFDIRPDTLRLFIPLLEPSDHIRLVRKADLSWFSWAVLIITDDILMVATLTSSSRWRDFATTAPRKYRATPFCFRFPLSSISAIAAQDRDLQIVMPRQGTARLRMNKPENSEALAIDLGRRLGASAPDQNP